MGLQLAAGAVTVVLAQDVVRRRLLAMLEGSPGDGPDGADGPGTLRLTARADEPLAPRLERVRRAATARLVVVDRLTAGLDAATRRRVLREVRDLVSGSTGPAVLVDDEDVVAALAVADQVLRVDPRRGLVVEAPDGPTGFGELDYRAS